MLRAVDKGSYQMDGTLRHSMYAIHFIPVLQLGRPCALRKPLVPCDHASVLVHAALHGM
jgi:hypothetical protein